jgi:hypothetical protein
LPEATVTDAQGGSPAQEAAGQGGSPAPTALLALSLQSKLGSQHRQRRGSPTPCPCAPEPAPVPLCCSSAAESIMETTLAEQTGQPPQGAVHAPQLCHAAICAPAALGRAEALVRLGIRVTDFKSIVAFGRQQNLRVVMTRASRLRMSSGLRELS